MYKVIKSFSDLQDNGFVYKAGDTFPRLGKEVTKERLKELLSEGNKRGEKLIEGEPESVAKVIEEMAPARGRKRRNAGTDSQVD